jgi:glycosyltransferase involved in cell wall biosynthesis
VPPTKPKLLFVLNMPAARHPVIHLYLKALTPKYEIAIASTDPEAVAATFPGVQCFQAEPNYSFRALLGISPGPAETSGPPAPQEGSNVSASSEKGVDIGLLTHNIHTTVWRVLTYMKRCKPAAVIAIDGELLPTARLLSGLLRIPYFYVMCEVFPNQFDWTPRRLSRSLALIEMFGVRRATKIFTAHVSHTKLLARRYGVGRSRFVEIGICCEVPERSAVGKTHSPLRIYYHGTYSRGRGLESLIQAMSQVSDAHLYMRVFGPNAEILRKLTREKSLEGKITFLDPVRVDELPAASTEFDVGVIVACPTTANGRFVVGFKLYEYMSAGLSIVCPKSHALGPFLENHPIGVVFEGCETNAIAAAIRHCVENPEKVATWKSRARELAESEFNAEVQGVRLRQAVDECLQRRRLLFRRNEQSSAGYQA